MLTIKQPMKLNIAGNIHTVSDGFAERIRSGYGLICAHISPKELLLLLAGGEEPQDVQGNLTNLALNSVTQNNTNFNLDIINHVVNRILFTDEKDFTYQDSVYVTSVLRQLGITDVSEFMKQMSYLNEDNRSVKKLLQLYQNHSEELTEMTASLRQQERTVEQVVAGEETHAAIRYTLFEEIYNRLGLSDIYQIVNAFHSNRIADERTLNVNELSLSEHLRLSTLISLSEEKNKQFRSSNVLLQHHINRYETGELLPPPGTEHEVLEQGAAAVLLNLMDHVFITALNHTLKSQRTWVDVRNAVRASAENSLFRFETYHSEVHARNQASVEYSEQLNALYRQELTIVNKLLAQSRGREEIAMAVPQERIREGVPLTLTNTNSEFTEETEHSVEKSETETVIWENAIKLTERTRELLEGRHPFRKEQRPIIPPLPTPEDKEKEALPPKELVYLEKTEFLNTVQSLNQMQQVLAQLQQENNTVINNEERQSFHKSLMQSLTELNQVNSVFETQEQNQKITNQKFQETQNEWNDHRRTEGHIHLASSVDEENAEEEPSGTIVERLHQINERNRELLERVQTNMTQRLQSMPPPAPDRKRIQADALRALEHPEQVIRELLEALPTMEHPGEQPLTESMLANADEGTRAIIEAVMQYQKDPQAAAEAGLVKPATIATLNAEAERIEQRQTVERILREENLEQEKEILHETLELFNDSGGKRSVMPSQSNGMAPKGRPNVPIIHRRTETGVSEEVLSQMEQQRTSDVVRTEEVHSVVNQDSVQTQINELKQELITKSTEDITEIVNKTLARQIGTISERVYSQMERKLQSERARRGRY